MQCNFTAQTIQNRKLTKETYWSLYLYQKKNKLRMALWLTSMLCFLVLNIFLSFTIMVALCIFMWLLFLTCLLLYLLKPQIAARNEERKRIKLTGCPTTYTKYCFYDEYFEIHSGVTGSLKKIPYSNIVSLRETKHYYILIFKEVSCTLIEKAGIEGISVSDAYRYLFFKWIDRTD